MDYCGGWIVILYLLLGRGCLVVGFICFWEVGEEGVGLDGGSSVWKKWSSRGGLGLFFSDFSEWFLGMIVFVNE